MKIAGALLVLVGFAWIVCADLYNLAEAKGGWSDEREHFRAERNYSRDEVFGGMLRVSESIRHRHHFAVWGGVIMLFGWGVLENARGKDRK